MPSALLTIAHPPLGCSSHTRPREPPLRVLLTCCAAEGGILPLPSASARDVGGARVTLVVRRTRRDGTEAGMDSRLSHWYGIKAVRRNLFLSLWRLPDALAPAP